MKTERLHWRPFCERCREPKKADFESCKCGHSITEFRPVHVAADKKAGFPFEMEQHLPLAWAQATGYCKANGIDSQEEIPSRSADSPVARMMGEFMLEMLRHAATHAVLDQYTRGGFQ